MRGDRFLEKDEEILTAWRELSVARRLILLEGLRSVDPWIFEGSNLEVLAKTDYLNSRRFRKWNRWAVSVSWHKYVIHPPRGRWKRRAGFSAVKFAGFMRMSNAVIAEREREAKKGGQR
ncbi:hypothetical protein HY406_00515 [Candidatus Giovannonibacteria bacterium]|nr:hypothetical protein [Candidatus Giovannonibacteria bacterium]